jgi:hypothetical protein
MTPIVNMCILRIDTCLLDMLDRSCEKFLMKIYASICLCVKQKNALLFLNYPKPRQTFILFIWLFYCVNFVRRWCIINSYLITNNLHKKCVSNFPIWNELTLAYSRHGKFLKSTHKLLTNDKILDHIVCWLID